MGVLGAALLVVDPDRASAIDKTMVGEHDAFAIKPLPDGLSFQADNIPGDVDARITQWGFTLKKTSVQWTREERITVIGCGRNGRTVFPWTGGEPLTEGGILWFQGDRMAMDFHHSSVGLRQNFTVFTPPAGTGDLSIQVQLSGDFTAQVEDGGGIRFFDSQGSPAFDYRDLRCWDADRKPLTSWMVLTDMDGTTMLSIHVDDQGAAYPITIDPVSTSPSTLLTGPVAGQEFGYSVCTAGDLNGDGRSDVAVGAWQTTVGGLTGAGRVYVYYGTNTGISTTASVILDGNQIGAQLGNAVSTAGDVNGDGYSDLVVGSRTWESNTSTELSEGAAFLYYGSATGINTTPDLILQTNHADDNFGSNVACAGDINNDGYSDVLVGAYLASYPTFNEGAVFVYLGSAAGLNPVAHHRLERNQGGAFFGRCVSSAGDVNGDGFSDVIIGSSKWIWTAGASDQGSAFLYYGSAIGLGAGMNPAFGLQLFGNGSNVAYYGFWAACAGDLNGDGYSDVAVGAYNEENGQTD